MEIKFHLDEHVPVAIAQALARRSVDVTTSQDSDLLQARDEEQLEWSAKHGRVMFTCDDDFLRLSSQGKEHCGIVYCHQDKYSIGQTIDALTTLWREKTPEEMVGRVVYL